MLEVFDQLFFSVDFATATVRLSVALIFASIGELFAERSGVVNIGLEGMMLIGAFMGVVGSFLGGSAWWGLPMAILGGALAALLLAYVSITLAGDQIVCGVALNIAILGLTTFLSRTLWGVGKSPEVAQFKAIHIAGLSDLPVIGELFFRYSPLTYIAFLCLPLTAWVLLRTRWGLSISAVGEHPRAADSVGISVFRTRYLTVILSGMFAALGGAYLSIGHLNTFVEGMTGGRGFIALAIVIVAKWFPYRTVVIVLCFGAAEALSFRLEAIGVPIPSQIFRMFPYVFVLLFYAGLVGKTRPPAAITLPYLKD